MKSDVLKDLELRGLIKQVTHGEELDEVLQNRKVTLYCGFDPSAASLHVGNLLMICGLAQFRRHGHDPVALVGGATGLIGDPSGKDEERELLDDEVLAENLDGIAAQLRDILGRAMEMHPETLGDADDAADEVPVVNNADWMKEWSYIDFLRDVGKNFRVNVMIQKDSVRARLEEREQGISYTEFSYMLIQAYDFLHLFEERDCALQIGGSDQWGNITAGADLIRRKLNKPAFGLTFPLILSASGKKLGKTEKGAVWLDADWTSPFEFYQYWVRREDSEVIDLLKKFTFLPHAEINAMTETILKGENRGEIQKKLAHEVTWLVHGKEEADKAVRASKMLYGERIEGLTDRDLQSVFAEVPSTVIERSRLEEGINIVDLFAETELQKSKGQARRLIKQGGGYVNNERVDDIDYELTLDDLASDTKLVLRAGKKRYHLVSVE
jgi:tyrosyl-tRNA synthetase